MKDNNKLALVIPCYNEASRGRLTENDFSKRLAKLKNEIDSNVSNIVFVNDGSTDSTSAEIKLFIKEQKLDNQWIVIDSKCNQGKGKSLLIGMEKAATLAGFVGYIDADLSTPVRKMCRLPLKPNVVYYGNRTYTKKASAIRAFVSRLAKLSVRMFTGVKVQDTQCPFKVVPSDVFLAIKSNLKGYRWIYDIELLWELQEYGCKMREVKVLFHNMEDSTLQVCSALKRSTSDLLSFCMKKRKRKEVK